jgi:hypothetical protein
MVFHLRDIKIRPFISGMPSHFSRCSLQVIEFFKNSAVRLSCVGRRVPITTFYYRAWFLLLRLQAA